MTFPYKGLRSMADLWVNIDNRMDYPEKIMLSIATWIVDQPVGTKFELLTDDDGSLHIYTKVK